MAGIVLKILRTTFPFAECIEFPRAEYGVHIALGKFVTIGISYRKFIHRIFSIGNLLEFPLTANNIEKDLMEH